MGGVRIPQEEVITNAGTITTPRRVGVCITVTETLLLDEDPEQAKRIMGEEAYKVGVKFLKAEAAAEEPGPGDCS